MMVNRTAGERRGWGVAAALLVLAGAGSPAGAVTLSVRSAEVERSGDAATVCVDFASEGSSVAGLQHDLVWDSGCAALVERSCQAAVGHGKKLSTNQRNPSTLSTIMLAFDNTDPIPDDSELYCCRFRLNLDRPGTACPVTIQNPITSDPHGVRLAQPSVRGGQIALAMSGSGGAGGETAGGTGSAGGTGGSGTSTAGGTTGRVAGVPPASGFVSAQPPPAPGVAPAVPPPAVALAPAPGAPPPAVGGGPADGPAAGAAPGAPAPGAPAATVVAGAETPTVAAAAEASATAAPVPPTAAAKETPTARRPAAAPAAAPTKAETGGGCHCQIARGGIDVYGLAAMALPALLLALRRRRR
jgi:hypothetical protein